MNKESHKTYFKDSSYLLNSIALSGLSKSAFAKRIGKSRGTIENWLNRGGVTYVDYLLIEKRAGRQEEINDINAQIDTQSNSTLSIEQNLLRDKEELLKDKKFMREQLIKLEQENAELKKMVKELSGASSIPLISGEINPLAVLRRILEISEKLEGRK